MPQWKKAGMMIEQKIAFKSVVQLKCVQMGFITFLFLHARAVHDSPKAL